MFRKASRVNWPLHPPQYCYGGGLASPAKPAQETDINSASARYRQLSPDRPPLHLHEIVAQEHATVFVKRIEGAVAGMAVLAWYRSVSGACGWIEDVVVDEGHRGKGSGREFVGRLTDGGRRLGQSDLNRTSRAVRVAANQLYRSMGFEPYETNFYRYHYRSAGSQLRRDIYLLSVIGSEDRRGGRAPQRATSQFPAGCSALTTCRRSGRHRRKSLHTHRPVVDSAVGWPTGDYVWRQPVTARNNNAAPCRITSKQFAEEPPMRRVFAAPCAATLALLLQTCAVEESGKTELKTTEERFSYSIGMEVAESIKQMGATVDLASFMQGVRDVMGGAEPMVTAEEADAIKRETFTALRDTRKAADDSLAATNLAEGEKFLAVNGKADGVTTTASGLQYKVLVEGTGPMPKATDKVKVHYTGTLLDGKEFDSSIKRGEPVTFPVNGVIPGWSEGLQLMKVGSKHMLYVPAALGYGPRRTGPDITPNSTLIFEVELLGIEG